MAKLKLASWADIKGAGRAGIHELLAQLPSKGDMVAGAVGGALAGTAGYALSKRWGGKPSWEERTADKAVASHEERKSKLESEGKKPGYIEDLVGTHAKVYREAAGHMARYPLRSGATLAATTVGIPVGIRMKKAVEEGLRRAKVASIEDCEVWARVMAKEAAFGLSMAGVQKGVGVAARGLLRSTTKQRAITGAALGAAKGIGGYMAAPPEQKGSLVARVGLNAAGGALIGTGSKEFAKQVVKARNPVGSFVRGGMKAAKGV